MSTDAKIQHFWSWFSNHLELVFRVGTKCSSEKDFVVFEKQLNELGISCWELIGLNIVGETNTFIFSPAGDPAALQLTKKIVRQAPDISGWAFLPAKPPKKWERRFTWGKARIPIDASSWKFCVFEYEDGKVDIVLDGNSTGHIKTNSLVAHFVVEAELGELLYIERVNQVDVENDLSAELSRVDVDALAGLMKQH
ncbi:hypothetical protein [Hirschia maritima]|uniref:hypothetical protein n=1 Tax=Hirschia maritima TaxID=1121961 RepID=UPI00037BF943|nr:hypothetical protein [Hirschia maritima]